MSAGAGIEGDWVRPFKLGPYIVMFSKAPFYFSGWLPTTRWGSLAWRRYEFKMFRLIPKRRS